jgi:hypothetical protein
MQNRWRELPPSCGEIDEAAAAAALHGTPRETTEESDKMTPHADG